MKPDLPPVAFPPATTATLSPAPPRRRWWLYVLGLLVVLVLVVVSTVAFTLWWIQRPIKPVVLTATEKTVLEEKITLLSAAPEHPPQPVPDPKPMVIQELDRPYVPGSRVLKLTERELNGLLNANTDLGQTVRLEFGRDAINAYLAIPIPEDFPVGGGRMFRARGRFRVSLNEGQAPYAILEDITIFGLSLPKAWLGGLKGENLIAKAMGEHNGEPILQGVKSLRVEPGALVIEVNE